MRNYLSSFCWWLSKQPSKDPNSTEVIDQAIKDLRALNQTQTEALGRVEQPDILRSLVISMNSGRNR